MTTVVNALATTSAALGARVRAFARDQRGSFALWLAAMVPGVAVLSIGAVELGKVAQDRTRMQDVADMAALVGARQLAVGTTGAAERAEASARAQLQDIEREARAFDVDATLSPTRSLGVEITATRTSFFGNLLPPGGFFTKVRAEAASMTQEPICVLGMGGSGTNIDVRDSSRLTAECTAHSNMDMTVAAGARLTAMAAQAVGRASGPITPTGRSGAEVVQDPFSSRGLTIPACDEWEEITLSGAYYYEASPGIYCGNFILTENMHVHMRPGTYYFVGASSAGKLSLKLNARLPGSDVTLYFGNSKLEVAPGARLDLKAPRTGADAGMLIVAARDNSKDFLFESSSIDRLEGVLYMPTARLVVRGSGQLAEQSKWTITMVRQLKIEQSAHLVVNTDYAGSTVPRPSQLNSPAIPRLIH